MIKSLSLILIAVAISFHAMADDHDFAVMIEGNGLSDQDHYEKSGVPIVFCAVSPAEPSVSSLDVPPSSSSFHVIIQNKRDVPDALTLDSYDWDHCLTFTIKDEDGHVYSVSTATYPVAANALETRHFTANGKMIIPVDFSRAGNKWEGLPRMTTGPELVTITATFTYANDDKPVTVSSDSTEVYLVPAP